eukprot:CAMPEP_0194261950 /NCGR_PEP_ID=MMETSP0158-20130606/46291_1 /TAXON_ID=33649 /ORGANISM="Thalassionema nitzschioides, Strain L26-B" /LENGTH=727 /DNA_ID=CAMNT_0039002091 /DNA_START=2738 /DNA_END=4921 /DNA_ORIENTATION=-
MDEYNVPLREGLSPSKNGQPYNPTQGVRAGRRPSMEYAFRVGRRFSNDEAHKRPGRRFSGDDQPYNPSDNPTLTMRHTFNADQSHLLGKAKPRHRPSLDTGIPYKPRHTRRQYQKYLSNSCSPLCHLWLCSTVVIGVMICLGRSIRITLDISTSNKEILGGAFPAFEGTHASIRSARKKNAPFSYNFMFYDQEQLHRERNLYRQTEDDVLPAIQELLELAEAALDFGPWSVTQKPSDSLAPSGNKHEFFFPAPYYWPKKRGDGKIDHAAPYELREGQHIPGTVLHENGSEKFDQSRLSDMQRNTTILGLAYFLSGNDDYAEVAARNIRTWFLDPSTMMTPHLLYSRVLLNHNQDKSGTAAGIIEFKDLHFFLDAIQMVMEYLENHEVEKLEHWFDQYLNFLETSDQAQIEKKSKDHHGLYFDIQQIAIANFLRDSKKVNRVWRRAESRISDQIAATDGALVEELQQNSCEHYQIFTLQGWWTLARMGFNILDKPKLWETHKHALCRASAYTIPYFRERSECPGNTDKENDQRWWPLVVEAVSHCPELQNKKLVWREWMSEESKSIPTKLYNMPRLFNATDGVAPFWSLGMPILKESAPGPWQEKAAPKPKPASKEGRHQTSNDDEEKGKSLRHESQKQKEEQPKISSTVEKVSKGSADSSKSKSTKNNVSNDPSDNFIPVILKTVAKTNPDMKERIDRIKRWQALGKTKIVQNMIKKSLDEILRRRV